MSRHLLLAAWTTLFLMGTAPVHGEPVTILSGDATHKVEAKLDQGQLLLAPADFATVTGFELKPEGLCRADSCVPLPPELRIEAADGTVLLNATGIAALLDQALAWDADQKVWSFGEALAGGRGLAAGAAPDFAVADRQGNIVRLSQFRGKKVMVLTWASWCGCSADLPNWQAIYEELKDNNFELIAAAQDTGGEQAAGKFYDRAKATYVTLIDPTHAVSSAFQMVNVPTAVWIDEQGTIVRAPEVAYTKQMNVLGQKIGDDRYVPALRDWVAKGAESEFVSSPDQLAARLAPRTLAQRQADAEFKLGVHFHNAGERELARAHWKKAQELNPDDWNYHRQDWTFSGEAMTKWFEKVRALNGRPYYEPAQFPAAE